MPSYCCSSSDFLQFQCTVLLSSFLLPLFTSPYFSGSRFCPFVAQINLISTAIPEIFTRTAQTTAALTSLKAIGTTGAFLSVPRYDWYAPLSHPSSCMFVNHGPSQQSCKEEYEPWKWCATARYYASYAKTMLPTTKPVPRFCRQSDFTKTSWPP